MRRILAPGHLLALLLLSPPLAGQNDWEGGLFTEARQLPLVSQSQLVRIADGEAVVELVQVFANDGDKVAQADYRLHLPTGAAVTAFGFWRSGRYLAAELKEKEEARRAHAAAASGGRATALLEREGTIHSFSVVPIEAGSLQQVETTIRLPVVRERGRSHLRLPVESFLGHATITSTAVIDLETDAPLRAFGVDGAPFKTGDRSENRARLIMTCDRSVDVWFSEEAPPLLTRAEVVDLDEGELGVQLRVVLNDAGEWSAPFRELVVLVDTSYSMRRRSRALADLVRRLLDQTPVPVRLLSVAETAVELDGSDREGLLTGLLSGEAGFRTAWDDLEVAAYLAGCSHPQIRCVAVTDPQIDGLTETQEGEFETLFLADADELAFYAEVLGPGVLAYQPGVEPAAALDSRVDELVLPVLEVTSLEQRGDTLELRGSPRLRVAEGGLLRLFATSRSEEPIELRLTMGEREIVRTVALQRVSAESRQGEAVRRGLYRGLLSEWMASYRRSRDPELRSRIVEVSLRESIPTALTSLHVSDEGVLPRTGTVAPLARRVGWTLLLLAGLVLLSAWRHGG